MAVRPMNPVICPECNADVPFHARVCAVCSRDIGPPNVRHANGERSALYARYEAGYTAAGVRNAQDALHAFESAAAQSVAVLCRSLPEVVQVIRSETKLFETFYSQLNQGVRLAEYNQWDTGRQAVDATLFPLYGHEIVFAALSLDNLGVRSYGSCHLVLRDNSIANRASVFEENSMEFCKRHAVVAGTQPPPGYRSLWSERAHLCVAKLHARVSPDTSPAHHASILLNGNDFVEVHIHGPIHRRAIERITVVDIAKGADRVLFESLKGECKNLEITVEMR